MVPKRADHPASPCSLSAALRLLASQECACLRWIIAPSLRWIIAPSIGTARGRAVAFSPSIPLSGVHHQQFVRFFDLKAGERFVAVKRAAMPPATLVSTAWALWWEVHLARCIPVAMFRP